MLKEAIEKLVALAAPTTYKIGDNTFSSNKLTEIVPAIPAPENIHLYSLDGIVRAIESEIDLVEAPVFVQISGWAKVDVFTVMSPEKRYTRQNLYSAHPADLPHFAPGQYMDFEAAMIALRSIFSENEGTAYLLDILSRITDENSVTSTDNGVTQTVEARKGIAMVGREPLKPRVALQPYRTFLEVEQPKSEFLVRVREGGQIAFFEADGGMWKLQARQTIKAYLDERLRKLIETRKVVVMV